VRGRVGRYVGVAVGRRWRWVGCAVLLDLYGYHDGSVLVAVGQRVNTASAAATELPVSTSNLSDLYDSLVERTPSGLQIDVMSAELVEVHVDVDIVLKSGYNPSSVTLDVQSALKEYLDPNVWDWNLQRIRRNEIISIVDSVDGVDYVDSLTLSGEPLIGVNNVGYLDLTGGTKATTTLTITGASSATYPANTASFFYVDSTGSNASNPKVYTFVNTASLTITAGSGSGTFQATANGVEYNKVANGGVIPNSVTLTGSANIQGTATAGTILGGSADSLQFVPLSGTVYVEDDLVLRNLGTLVTFGTLNVAVL